MKVAILIGSLREKSYNRAVANYAIEQFGQRVEFIVPDLNLPLMNEDLEANKPKEIEQFLSEMKQADAFMFITPEYNHSIPGVLKNAIDWASRSKIFNEKPAVILGASPGRLGTVRAQEHLKQSINTFAMKQLPGNEVFISNVHTVFDEDGNLIDDKTGGFINGAVEQFIEWSNQFI